MGRRIKKHRTAIIGLFVYNLVLFFPVIFMGRVVSPNDVFYNYYPWHTERPASFVQAQNDEINDPPTAYFTLMSLVRDDWRTFHWNPYVGSGIPGFGSSASAMLSPFILLPVLVVPEVWIYTAILFLKLNASFLFAYLWLREERLGRDGAAVGALVVAGAGVYAVRWLWQITNATALFPALLWVVRRMTHGKRNSIALMALLGFAFALSGFPAAILYGAWAAAAYLVYGLIKRHPGRGNTARALASALAATILAAMIALPSLVPFAQFLRRSGYLEMRQATSLGGAFPVEHWWSFVKPDRLGHPADHEWRGDKRLGPLNNYVETTIYAGLLTLPLAILGLLCRQARARWFWFAFGAVVLACIFGAPLVSTLIGQLPGFKYSALARVGLLLPLPIGYLAAAGTTLLRHTRIAHVLALLVAVDLALLAGRFYPYLKPEVAKLPESATVRFLQSDPAPFRIAPFFDYLWPNSAELVRVEDARSHFGSEADYRRLLLRIDPTAWGGASTFLTFNSLQFDFNDPLTGLVGIRWYIEHNVIDIIKWMIFSKTVPGVKETGSLQFRPGAVMERTVRVDAEPFWAIELPVDVQEQQGQNPRLEVTLSKHGKRVWSRAFTKRDANAIGKVYVPLRAYAKLGETVTLRVRSVGLRGWILRGENSAKGEFPLFYGRVTIPLIFDRELPDGRLFRNLAELPRFRAVSKLRKLNDDEFLAAQDVDFATEAVITDDPVMPPALAPTEARVTLTRYAPDEQRVVTESAAPFYLASSEKLTPELRVTIDGREARVIETDMLFAGLTVPAGRHEVVFSRRIARGWWWVAALGVGLWMVVVGWEVWRRRLDDGSGGRRKT